jgi:multisubunit Na+/H+ antiporter MnhG subunit
MNQRKNALLIRIHQAVIVIFFVFSLFVKEEVKIFFWLIIAAAALSLLIQARINGSRPDWYEDEVKKHPRGM